MNSKQIVILVMLVVVMLTVASALGNWSASINPDGIAPHPVAEGELQETQTQPRDAYWFGVSIGLLATSLLYFCIAMGLLIKARTSKAKTTNQLVYWIAGVAVSGFILSYLVDDYFY